MKAFEVVASVVLLLGSVRGLALPETGDFTIDIVNRDELEATLDKRQRRRWKFNEDVTYTATHVLDATDEGARKKVAGQTVSSGSYPHIYYNSEGDITNQNGNCHGSNMWEFPIKTDHTLYNGNAAGQDRVLFQVLTPSHNVYSVRFCGVMTHRAASTVARFKMCTWS